MTKTVDFGPIRLPADPIDGIMLWLKDAENAQALEPTAMTLATSSRDGLPHARIVLFKGLSNGQDGRRGISFYTNYDSPKSTDLKANPRAALVFFWPVLNRQIRIEGVIEKVSREESEEYYRTRPRGSRIGAWASPQSQKIQSRQELLSRVQEMEAKFPGEEVPLPQSWGGWRLMPTRVEFWQAGEFRLHDRFLFELQDSSWSIARLAP